MPACDGYPASATEGVNAALRCTFCGLKPWARGFIEGRHAQERRFGRHRLDWLFGEFGSEIFAARGGMILIRLRWAHRIDRRCLRAAVELRLAQCH